MHRNNLSNTATSNSFYSRDPYDLSPYYYLSNGKLSKTRRSSCGSSSNPAINDVYIYNKADNYKVICEEEKIQNRIDEYKNQIFRPFLEKLEREKQNECRRSELLEGINDSYMRKDMEKKFGVERAVINMKLKQEYMKLNEVVKNFEQNLRMNRKKKHE